MQVGFLLKYLLFLFVFNYNQMSTNLKKYTIRRKICPVGVAMIYADGQTELTKLTVAFCQPFCEIA